MRLSQASGRSRFTELATQTIPMSHFWDVPTQKHVFCAELTVNRIGSVTLLTDCYSSHERSDMKILQLNTGAWHVGTNATRMANVITARQFA